MNASPKTYHAVGSLCLIALSTLVWFVGIAPLTVTAQHKALESQRRHDTQQQALELADAVEALRRTVDRQQTTSAGSAVVSAPLTDLNRRINQLITQAQARGVTISLLTPQDPQDHHDYTKVPIEISGVCSYQGFVGWLSDLHAAFPDTRIDAFELEKSAAAGEGNRIRLTLTWFTAPS